MLSGWVLVAVVFDVDVFFFEDSLQSIFFTFAVFAVGGFVGVGAGWVAEVVAVGVSPESWVDDGEVFLGDGFGVVAVLFVEALFKGIIHGVDGGFSVFVALKSIDVGFLDEKEDKKEGGKGADDGDF